jgi:hypothetical protein
VAKIYNATISLERFITKYFLLLKKCSSLSTKLQVLLL